MRKSNPFLRHSVIFLAVGGVFSNVLAQERAALEEVVVTAQKREQSLQDVPISIVALGSEELAFKGIDDLKDIGASIPNLYLSPFNNDPVAVRLFMRGIGQNAVQVTQDPSVALYLDGVYIGTSFGSGFEGVDIERIEVLRGPQGTLYGRNATGGAVNILTKRASVEAFEFSQQLTAGELGTFKSKTSINVPLTDVAAFKLAYLNSRRDGHVENKGPGEDFGTEDRESLVADLRILPTDSLIIDYRYENAEIHDSQRLQQIVREGTGSPLGPLINLTQVSDDRLDEAVSLFPVPENDIEIDAHALYLTWTVNDNMTLKSITAKRDLDSLTSQYALATASANFGFGDQILINAVADTEFEQFSQEIQLIGVTDNLEYALGLYYYKDEAEHDASDSIRFGLPSLRDYTKTSNESLAIYSQVTWTPDWYERRWHFTVGARYSEDTREAFRVNMESPTFLASAPNGADYDKDFSNFNPALTVAYDINEQVNVYGKVVSGYKAGGTSNASTNLQLFQRGFEEEEILAYEVGLKGDFLERRARLNMAAFYMELDGLQSSVQTGPTPAGRDFLPIDDSIIQGFEFDLSVILANPLTLNLAYGYLDTELGENVLVSPAGTFETLDVMALAPENSYTVSLNYSEPLSLGTLFANISYNYQDEISTSINARDNSIIDDYGLMNASIGWSDIRVGDIPGSFKIMLWGKNLTDEEYGVVSTAAFSAFNADLIQTFGDPRTVGVSLFYDY